MTQVGVGDESGLPRFTARDANVLVRGLRRNFPTEEVIVPYWCHTVATAQVARPRELHAQL